MCDTEQALHAALFAAGPGSRAPADRAFASAASRPSALPLTPLPKHRGGVDAGSGGNGASTWPMPPQLVEMLSAVCHSCYGELRSHVIKLNSIELLGDVIHVLREEGLGSAPSAVESGAEGVEGEYAGALGGARRGHGAPRRRGAGGGGAEERAYAPMNKVRCSLLLFAHSFVCSLFFCLHQFF